MTKIRLFMNKMDGELVPDCLQRYSAACTWPRCIGEADEKGYYDPCGCDTDVRCIERNSIFVTDDADIAPLVEILTPLELLDMGYVEIMGSR